MVSKIWFRSVVICAVVALWAMPAVAQKGGQNPGSWDKLIANLERDDFERHIRRPHRVRSRRQVLRPASLYPNALYANYGAPYTAAALGPSPRFTAGLPPDVRNITLELPLVRIAPDEAVVLVGLTPPPEAYFSYQIYLATR